MARFDVQKFAVAAAEEKLINLDLSLGQIVRSKAVGSLVAYDDPWEVFCGNDLRFFVWPGPRGAGLDRQQIANAVRESLD
jgi:hypothetical protein